VPSCDDSLTPRTAQLNLLLAGTRRRRPPRHRIHLHSQSATSAERRAMSITAFHRPNSSYLGVTQSRRPEKGSRASPTSPTTTGTPFYSIRGIGFHLRLGRVAPTVASCLPRCRALFGIRRACPSTISTGQALRARRPHPVGQNSTGGAINFFANKPTKAFDAGGRVSVVNVSSVSANGCSSAGRSPTRLCRLR